MKVLKKQLVWFSAVLVTGIVLFVVNLMRSNDDFISGFACAISVVAAIKLLQLFRITRDPERLKRYQIQQHEERLIMLAQKSGHFTFMLTIMAEIFGGIVLMFAGNNGLANCLLIIAAVQSFVYLISYFWLSKKY